MLLFEVDVCESKDNERNGGAVLQPRLHQYDAAQFEEIC